MTDHQEQLELAEKLSRIAAEALEDKKGADFTEIAETVKRTAFKITRVGQLVAREASRRPARVRCCWAA